MSERKLINRVKKLKELEEQKAQVEKQIEAIKAEIKGEMREAEELKAGEFLVKWQRVKSNRLDTNAMKAAYGNICKQFTKQTETRRFYIAEA